jgi:predicted nucleic acid-binding protein
LPYLDTSVVVAYYLPEALSARVQAVYSTLTVPAISQLVELEFVSALSLRLRQGDLERAHVDQVVHLFLRHIEGGWYTGIHLNAGHYRLARDFVARFDLPLKSPDALHLAVCAAESMQLVTADHQLARNAETLGLEVEVIRS